MKRRKYKEQWQFQKTMNLDLFAKVKKKSKQTVIENKDEQVKNNSSSRKQRRKGNRMTCVIYQKEKTMKRVKINLSRSNDISLSQCYKK